MQSKPVGLVNPHGFDVIANDLMGPRDITVATREIQVVHLQISGAADSFVFVCANEQNESAVRVPSDGVQPEAKEF